METTLAYKSYNIPIKITPPQTKLHAFGAIQFEFCDQSYFFLVRTWGKEDTTKFRSFYAKSYPPLSDDEMFKQSARDIITGIMNIFFARQSNILDYAAYHLKHFPLGDNATYSDIIMEAACHAIIDCNFSVTIIYQKINLYS